MLVMNAQTSELLAVVNQPGTNPNNRSARASGAQRNLSVGAHLLAGLVLVFGHAAPTLGQVRIPAEAQVDGYYRWLMRLLGFRITGELRRAAMRAARQPARFLSRSAVCRG